MGNKAAQPNQQTNCVLNMNKTTLSNLYSWGYTSSVVDINSTNSEIKNKIVQVEFPYLLLNDGSVYWHSNGSFQRTFPVDIFFIQIKATETDMFALSRLSFYH